MGWTRPTFGSAAEQPRVDFESLSLEERAKLVAHYQRVAPLVAGRFDAIPVIRLYLRRGFDGAEIRVGPLHHALPAKVPTVEVRTTRGTARYQQLTVDSLLWRIHAYALGFESWTPTPSDPTLARFVRFNVTRPATRPSRYGSEPLSQLRGSAIPR